MDEKEVSPGSKRGRKRTGSTPEEDRGLQVDTIYGLEKENALFHKTRAYRFNSLFVRRGLTFDLSVTLKKPYNPEADKFHLELLTGKRPSKRVGTHIAIELAKDDFDKNEWAFKISKVEDKKLTLTVSVPLNALISKYTLNLEAINFENSKKSSVTTSYMKDVYVLFNPWCTEEEVYMPDDDERYEYVLNDSGHIYWGGRRPKPWWFGQFTKTAVDCTFHILDQIRASWRDNAREVARQMSAWANSCDQGGILTGNWSGDYEGGRKPWEWTGSVKILKQYYDTGKSVDFGQCWVFSGLITTLMRCVGIPARSVTNYDSAHDTDNNCTFDKYYDSDGTYLDDMSDDSCWNFHVWNDVWMSRPDLPEGFGGWQAIDGTPQEESRGIYRCGPSSLRAIKEGYVHYNYDTKFVFAEVNSDKVFWEKNEKTGEFEPADVQSNAVGRYMSTKAPKSFFGRLDVTDQYKFKEGSMLEREAIKKVLKRVKNPVLPTLPKDVTFSSDLDRNTDCGNGVDLILRATNNGDKPLMINAVVNAQIIQYNGVPVAKLEKKTDKVDLEPGKRHVFNFHYDADVYKDFVDTKPVIRMSFVMKAQETGQSYMRQKICEVEKPDLQVSLVGKSNNDVKLGETVKVRAVVPEVCFFDKFTNCELEVEGSAVEDEVEFRVPDSRKDTVIEKEVVIQDNAEVGDELQLIVTFNSKEISALTNTLELKVIG